MNALMIKVLHHLTQHFKEHAVLKGGVELALFSSPRSTNDLDFVFVPYRSKKDIVEEIEACLRKISEDLSMQVSSKNARFYVNADGQEAIVEIAVAIELASIPMNTLAIARQYGVAPQIIRVMKPEIALAHKLAAWNERRLIRDLYDIYYWFSVQNILPDLQILKDRLDKVESRIPMLRKRKKMTLSEFCDELQSFCEGLQQEDIDQELVGLPFAERQHLAPVLKSQLNRLIAKLKQLP